MTLKIKGAQYFGLLRGYIHCLGEIAVLTLDNKEEIEVHYGLETVRLIATDQKPFRYLSYSKH